MVYQKKKKFWVYAVDKNDKQQKSLADIETYIPLTAAAKMSFSCIEWFNIHFNTMDDGYYLLANCGAEFGNISVFVYDL